MSVFSYKLQVTLFTNYSTLLTHSMINLKGGHISVLHYHLTILKLHIMTIPHFVDIKFNWQSIRYHAAGLGQIVEYW